MLSPNYFKVWCVGVLETPYRTHSRTQNQTYLDLCPKSGVPIKKYIIINPGLRPAWPDLGLVPIPGLHASGPCTFFVWIHIFEYIYHYHSFWKTRGLGELKKKLHMLISAVDEMLSILWKRKNCSKKCYFKSNDGSFWE